MTKKQDLILEAEKLGLNITKKDTIAVLCEKIDGAGVSSKNCTKLKPSPKTKKAVGRPKLSPSQKSPKGKVIKVKLAKSPKPRVTKSPKPRVAKSPKTKTGTAVLNFIHQGTCKVEVNIQNNGVLSGDDISETLKHISDVIEDRYIVKQNNKKINLENYVDTKGETFTIEKDLSVPSTKVPNPIIDLTGINEYMDMEYLNLMGVTDRIFITNKEVYNSTPLKHLDAGFRNTNFVFHLLNNDEYYILNIALIFPGEGAFKVPLRLTTHFEKSNKKMANSCLSSSRPNQITVRNNKDKTIIFEGYGQNTNIKFNFNAKKIEDFYVLPNFLIKQTEAEDEYVKPAIEHRTIAK